MDEPRIASVKITYAQGIFDLEFLNGSARAALTFDDGSTDEFYWYHDEISFTEKDFIGSTKKELLALFMEKDLRWLRT